MASAGARPHRSTPTDVSSESKATVAVVVPCRNAAPFLDQMIASVAAQTLAPTRRVLADDGSTDASARIAADAGWEVVPTGATHEKGLGIARGRNLAMQAVDTEFVAFLDADDWWDPAHLQDCISLLVAHPEAVLCFGALRTTDDGERRPIPEAVPRRQPYRALPALLASNYVPVSAVVARRDAVLRLGGFREGMHGAEDFDMWLRLAEHGPFLYRDALSLHYRVHPGQLSRNTLILGVNALRVRRDALERLRAAAPDGHLDEETLHEAAVGWEESLDVLWYFGHRDAHTEWADAYRAEFGKGDPLAPVRTGVVGALHHAGRRLLGRIPT